MTIASSQTHQPMPLMEISPKGEVPKDTEEKYRTVKAQKAGHKPEQPPAQ